MILCSLIETQSLDMALTTSALSIGLASSLTAVSKSVFVPVSGSTQVGLLVRKRRGNGKSLPPRVGRVHVGPFQGAPATDMRSSFTDLNSGLAP